MRARVHTHSYAFEPMASIAVMDADIKRNVSRLCKHKIRHPTGVGSVFFSSGCFRIKGTAPIDPRLFQPINCICLAGIGGFEEASRNCQKRRRAHIFTYLPRALCAQRSERSTYTYLRKYICESSLPSTRAVSLLACAKDQRAPSVFTL